MQKLAPAAIKIPTFHRVLFTNIDNHENDEESASAATSVVRALKLREKYLFCRRVPEELDKDLQAFQAKLRTQPFKAPLPSKGGGYSVHFGDDGVAEVRKGGKQCADWAPPRLVDFNKDLRWFYETCVEGKKERSFCFHRLSLLEVTFGAHRVLNGHHELKDQKLGNADWFSVTKVDNHIHAASAMTSCEMVNFIKAKGKTEAETVVLKDGSGTKTLSECLKSCGIDSLDGITTDRLDCVASGKMFHRFDNFNDSYSPFGMQDLRTIFMKTSNYIDGRFFAEIIRDIVFKRIQEQENQVAIEPRLSIYGRNADEWEELAKWMVRQRLYCVDAQGHQDDRVKWMIQIPRLCNVFMGNSYQDFGELLRNIFEPMFEATVNPEAHPELHTLLCHMGALDCVDDESTHGPLLMNTVYGADEAVTPSMYKERANPPYAYWMYHLHANLYVLNRLREERGLNTIAFKPHCGESGDRHHLATGYLLADSVNHGIKLRESPVLQYLYYCSQIGLALCPQSNDCLFVKLPDSPIGQFHRRGLRVCLGTDDPLQFSSTLTPLIEEYIVSKTAFGFDSVDLCEIARNTVLTSCFDHTAKARMLGESYTHPHTIAANDMDKTNISNIRVAFRLTGLLRELGDICMRAGVPKDSDGCWKIAGHTIPDASDLFHESSAAIVAYEKQLVQT